MYSGYIQTGLWRLCDRGHPQKLQSSRGVWEWVAIGPGGFKPRLPAKPKAGHFLRSLSFSYEPALFLDTAAYLRGPLAALHGEEVCSQFLLGQAMIKFHEIESSIWGSISSVFRFWLKNSTRGNTRTQCPAQGLLELEDIKGQPTPSGEARKLGRKEGRRRKWKKGAQ